MNGFGIIAACTKRARVIGQNGGIPWVLREDRDYFKRVTKDAALLMGRATWEESNIHLPHSRATIVMSRDASFRDSINKIPNVSTVSSFCEALDAANKLITSDTVAPDAVWVVGGEAVYERALTHSLARELHLTEIDLAAEEEEKIISAKRVARFPSEELWSEMYSKIDTVEGAKSGLDGLPTYNFNRYIANST
ncbi:hypothetical protein TrST_g12237 [Triparma strigata]|uniref:Bifunctional dihydrofolate reductase-thymidylate synthase n=1 Tax=Triparma strigata TaxID=1606541 RepID=A0A9W7BE05_9STRA|nr:hypothetical protein TrST_g12237 [Triparma strigata]